MTGHSVTHENQEASPSAESLEIMFTSTQELDQFEKTFVNNHFSLDAQGLEWTAPGKLSDAIRPPKFFGPIVDIHIEPFSNPGEEYAALWPKRAAQLLKNHDITGFQVVACLYSTGRGIIGYTNPKVFYNSRGTPSSSNATYIEITRRVERPTQTTLEAIEKLRRASSEIGHTLTSRARARIT